MTTQQIDNIRVIAIFHGWQPVFIDNELDDSVEKQIEGKTKIMHLAELPYYKDYNLAMDAWKQFLDLKIEGPSVEELDHAAFKFELSHLMAFNSLEEFVDHLAGAIRWYLKNVKKEEDAN